jgi:hypothetical protein
MRAIAKWLIHGASTAAEADGGAAAQTEGLALGVNQFKIAFDTQRSVVVYGDFCARHLRSWVENLCSIGNQQHD